MFVKVIQKLCCISKMRFINIHLKWLGIFLCWNNKNYRKIYIHSINHFQNNVCIFLEQDHQKYQVLHQFEKE